VTAKPLLTLTDARLRLVLDAIPARVSLLDRDQRHCYVNAEYAELVGRPVDEILGRTAAELLGTAAYDSLKPQAERALAGETVNWQGWLPFDRGGRIVQRVYVPYRTEAGAVEGYFVFARDLAEIESGEWILPNQIAALHTSEALNAAITASALDCIIAIDETGHVIEFNPAAEETFGLQTPRGQPETRERAAPRIAAALPSLRFGSERSSSRLVALRRPATSSAGG